MSQHVVRFFYRPALAPGIKALLFPFYLASLIYGGAMRFRAWAYEKGLFASVEPSLPAICVGNLNVGGAGKTPVTMFVAKRLRAYGRKPVIISRGYRGKREGRIALVSDGEKMLLDARQAGDEPVMMAEKLPGVPVVIGAKRPEAINYAKSRIDADAALCDDAFQHLRLKRSLNLLCVNGETGFGNHQLLPLGPLREPFSALARADAILVNEGRGLREDVKAIAQKYGFRGVVIPWHYRIDGFLESGRDDLLPADMLLEKDIHAFAATAHPEGFFATLENAGFRVAARSVKSDHAPWLASDMKSWPRADFHVCTEKDFVKIQSESTGFDGRILACVVRPHLVEDDIEILDALIKEKL